MDLLTLIILFRYALTPWVCRLILRTDLWSDGLAYPLGNTLWLTGYPRVINVVGTHGMFLVVTHSDWSVSLSPVPFPLYICCFFASFFTFHNKFLIRELPSILLHRHFVYFVRPSSTPFPLPSSRC